MKALATFSEIYGKELSPVATKVYETALADIGDEQLEQALSACLKECRFMPTPADIRIQAEKIIGASKTDRALIDWEAIKRYAWKYSPDVAWRGPMGKELPPPAISEQGEWSLRQIGGYMALVQCGYDETALMFRKKDFDAAWLRYGEIEKTGYTPISAKDAQKILDQIPGYKQLMGGRKL